MTDDCGVVERALATVVERPQEQAQCRMMDNQREMSCGNGAAVEELDKMTAPTRSQHLAGKARVQRTYLPLVAVAFIVAVSYIQRTLGSDLQDCSAETRAVAVTKKATSASIRTDALQSLFLPKKQDPRPQWLKDYVKWHNEMRSKFPDRQLFEDPDRPNVVIRVCPTLCGGLFDRMASLRTMLKDAHESQRVLLIKWFNVYDLERFFLPNEINWTVPITDRTSTPERMVSTPGWAYTNFKNESSASYGPKPPVVIRHLKQQSLFDWGKDMPTYRDAWHLMFRPTARLAKLVEGTFDELALIPGQYSAVHLRVRHPANFYQMKNISMDEHDVDQVGGLDWTNPLQKECATRAAIRALNCTQILLSSNATTNVTATQDEPLYLLSDSEDLVNYMVHDVHTLSQRQQEGVSASDTSLDRMALATVSKSPRLVSRQLQSHTVHFDFPNGTWEEYANSFVDLYTIVHAKCVTLGIGNFAVFGLKISGNRECIMDYIDRYSVGEARKIWDFKAIPGAQRCPLAVPPPRKTTKRVVVVG